MPLATSGEVRVLNGLLNDVYVSLHTGNPGNTGANEVAGNAYVRRSAAFTLSGNNPTLARNSAVIQFPQATGAWGNITHFGLWSALSGGDYLGGDAVTEAKTVGLGDVARWDINTLVVEAN